MNKISNIEWGLLIGFMALIDAIQFGLDLIPAVDLFFGFLSEIIDVAIAFGLALYFMIRSGNIDWKKILTMVTSFLGKEVSAGSFPLWTLEVLAMFALQKVDERLAKLGAIGQLASQALHQAAAAEGAESGETGGEAAVPSLPSTPELPASAPATPDRVGSQIRNQSQSMNMNQNGDMGGRDQGQQEDRTEKNQPKPTPGPIMDMGTTTPEPLDLRQTKNINDVPKNALDLRNTPNKNLAPKENTVDLRGSRGQNSQQQTQNGNKQLL